jgi:adenosine deaminase
MTVSNTTLKEEYKKLAKAFNYDKDILKTLLLNSVDALFVDEAKKEELKKKVKANF